MGYERRSLADSYIIDPRNDNRDGNTPTIVSEWSLAVPDDV